jgi:hypothetical protein
MHDLDVAPFVFQVFGNEAAMAVVGLFFAAQEAASVQQVGRDRLLDPSRSDEVKELRLVQAPVAFALFEGVEDVGRGLELGNVNVIDAADGSRKILKIILLRKAGELRSEDLHPTPAYSRDAPV